MILDHIADGTRFVIKGSSSLDSKVLCHGDLNTLHVGSVPKRVSGSAFAKRKYNMFLMGRFPR